MKLLLANIGSTSRRYALFENQDRLAEAHLEENGSGYRARLNGPNAAPASQALSKEEYLSGAAWFLDRIRETEMREGKAAIGAAGVRIVAPGSYFQKHRSIDETYLDRLDEARSYAPLHVGPAFEETARLRSLLPGIPLIGISDSAFHADMPRPARAYALPNEVAERWDIHRFGYHGLSAQSVLRKLATRPGGIPGRIVLCHLGGGASTLAIRNGRSADATMGFSPLEGLIMGTRVGDIDASALLYLGRKTGLDPDDLEAFLNRRCGLLGLSGLTGDMRTLLERERDGHPGAALAVEVYLHRLRKSIAAMAAVLGGADCLMFTGAIGEHSPEIRARACDGMEWMGIRLDADRNRAAVAGDAVLHAAQSDLEIESAITEELQEMAATVMETIKA